MLVLSSASRRTLLLGTTLGLAVFGAARADASGIDIGENGPQVLARGGADVSLLDTAYALQFNPAGMAFSEGLDVRVETLMINPGVSYTNAAPGTAVTNNMTASDHNLTGISYGPAFMATYHPPKLKWFAFGVGAWGPPGVINYRFTDPRNFSTNRTTDLNAADVATPARYSTIQQHTVVAFPSIGFAWRPIPQFSIGGTLQYVVSNIGLSTSLQGLPSQDASLLGVPPGHVNSIRNDVVATIKTSGIPRLSGVVGAIYAPIPSLMISFSFRPMVAVTSTGSLDAALGPDVANAGCGAGQKYPACGIIITTPSGTGSPTSTLNIKLPPVIRAGVSYKWNRLSTALEYVWEGWSVNNSFTLSTDAVVKGPLLATAVPGSNGQVKIGSISIPNNWQDTHSARVGAGYDILRGDDFHHFTLQVNAGFMLDGNAIPNSWQKLPFATGTMYGPTVGLSVGWHGIAANFGFAYFIPQTVTVTNSLVAKPVALPDATAPTIGNGSYTTNIWAFAMGLSYTGLGG